MDLPLVELTCVDVESDEGEGALVNATVHPLVDSLHKTQVHVPGESVAAAVGAGSLEVGHADETVEIVDATRIAADLVWRGRVSRPRKMEVDVWAGKRGGI
jgi:hypothetical protein